MINDDNKYCTYAGFKQEEQPTLNQTTTTRTTTTKATTTTTNVLNDVKNEFDVAIDMHETANCIGDYKYNSSETAIATQNLQNNYLKSSSSEHDRIKQANECLNTTTTTTTTVDIKQEFLSNSAIITDVMNEACGYADIGSDVAAINGEFDTAEVTITMSATAIGTIIPGNERVDSIQPDTAHGDQRKTPVKAASQFKPNAVYLCNQCQYPCESVEELREHHDKHSSTPMMVSPRSAADFECEICHCKYKSIALLKHHMKRHIARKYSCPQCPKTYINRTELMAHMQLHTGIVPHKCDMCDKQFNYPHHLKRHKDVTHFGKRHICPVDGCGRKFTTSAQLKMHTWNHNGYIPYKCKYCDRDFKKREPLRQHTRKAHNIILSEEDIAEIFRTTCGYTNPHDFTVPDSSGKMLRRSEVEATSALMSTESNSYMPVIADDAASFSLAHKDN